MTAPQTAALLLQDGTYLQGRAIGAISTTVGEICFNTGMTGYQEIYTDPSYYGQIIVNTTSHIGNYGVLLAEAQARQVMFAGLVCDGFSEVYSRAGADGSLQHYLSEAGIVGIADIDTRSLVRHIRTLGAQNACISSEGLSRVQMQAILEDAPDMANLELASQVSTRAPYRLGSDTGIPIAVLDLGVKKSILDHLALRGLDCHVWPARTRVEEILAANPAGYFISNGPGDPAAMDYAADTVRALQATGKPLFGICLGHQILARANGVETYKMHHGHRGLNHPVKNLITGRCEITSQNHGFAVAHQALAANPDLELTHLNLNDDTVEGLRHKSGRAFSVQYHPEASPGPHDSHYLFDEFVNLVEGYRI